MQAALIVTFDISSIYAHTLLLLASSKDFFLQLFAAYLSRCMFLALWIDHRQGNIGMVFGLCVRSPKWRFIIDACLQCIFVHEVLLY